MLPHPTSLRVIVVLSPDPLVPEEGDIGDGDADARGTYRWEELEFLRGTGTRSAREEW